MFIYRIRNTKTGHRYIGKTVWKIVERFSRHKTVARSNGQTHLYRAMRKYGFENFLIELVEECGNMDELNMREIWHIENEKPEYNMTDGGDGGSTHNSEAWKEGMRKRRSYVGENNPMYGKSARVGTKHTPETIAEQSEARRKFWEQNGELREKRSNELKGENNPMFGKVPANARKFVYNEQVYPSLAAAARETGFSSHKLKKLGKFYDN